MIRNAFGPVPSELIPVMSIRLLPREEKPPENSPKRLLPELLAVAVTELCGKSRSSIRAASVASADRR